MHSMKAMTSHSLHFLVCLLYIPLSYCQELTLTPTILNVPIGETATLNCEVSLTESGHSGTETRPGRVVFCKGMTEMEAYNFCYNCTQVASWNYTIAHVGASDGGVYTCSLFQCSLTKASNSAHVQITNIGTKEVKSTTKRNAGTTTRHCDPNQQRQNQTNNCVPSIQNIESLISSLTEGNISRTEVKHTIDNTLNKLQDFSQNNEHSSSDLDSSINLIDKILDVSETANVSLPQTVVVKTIDNLLAEKHVTAWQNTSSKPATATVSKILKTVDKFGLHVLNTVNQNESVTFNTTKNMADDDVSFPDAKNLRSSSLELPAQIQGSNESVSYLAVKYKTIGDILNGNSRQNETSSERVGSDILSLTLKNALSRETLKPPLSLKFLKEKSSTAAITECVFWNFDHNNGTGGWSTAGCKTEGTDDLYTQCTCNHLTNFAILLRPYSKVHDDEDALHWISLIGCIISITFSLITVIVYLVFWKSITSETTKMIDKITVSLCLSIVVAYSLFLGGVDRTQYKVGCIIITALLQWLFLFIFFLMLAMGWYYFISVSLVKISFSKATKFKSNANTISKFIWGIVTLMPVIITAVTFGVVYSSGKNYHSDTSCWLSFESGALYGFIVPVAVIILVNIVIVISLWMAIRSSTLVSKGTAKKQAMAGVRSICILVPVLGVTWLFGLLSVNDDVIAFQYIFSILNSVQGLFIFITKCIFHKKIRKAFMKRMGFKESEHSRSKSYPSQSNGTQSSRVTESSIHSRGGEVENKSINEDLVKGIFQTIENSPP
ncbi:adhesion G protein-coupled receptor L2-like isoform X2 [Ostrea edulis]|uniref:adhesion G protein-coupled receptor L2-like isoform X2 n=1 Tax=Ostrea edulis TaxID=37623 RepID=UPI0024AEB2E6|nr:adhesion G protein-coupled receptor L2-like isoform X2 [Ostrea edulis]